MDDIAKLAAEVREAVKSDLKVIKDVSLWVPTGVPDLDIKMGGGAPCGRLTTPIGKKSVGKSSLVVKILANTQALGGIAVLMDAERSMWLKRAVAMGIDPEKLIFTQPDTLDTYEVTLPDGTKEKRLGMFDLAEKLLWVVRKKNSSAIITMVGDSIAGSSTAREMEGDVGDATMGRHSNVVSQALRKITGYLDDFNVCLVLVNQFKEKVGTLYGDNKTYMAKNPLDFHSSITLEMREVRKKDDKREDHIVTGAYVSKNKLANPFRETEWHTWFDRGIDTLWETISCLDAYKCLGAKSGYVEWDGKSRRRGELYEMAKADPGVELALFEMVDALISRETGKVDHHYSEMAKKKGAKSETKKSAGRAPVRGTGPEVPEAVAS